jgi:hypothetical protein
MGFAKGQGGRPKGATNKVTTEIKELATKLFTPKYWQTLKEKLEAGTLHPSIEAKMLAYAYGEPKQDKSTDGRIIVNVGFLGHPNTVAELPHTVVLETHQLQAPITNAERLTEMIAHAPVAPPGAVGDPE